MSLSSYKYIRLQELKLSHPHITSHTDRMNIIMKEWQEKLKKNIVIKDKSTIYPARHNKKWSKFEEQQLIDGIIMGKSHPEIGEIHQRTETSITSRLYAIAIRLIKENKTNISDIVTIFDLNRDILSSLINKSLSKINK
jgi:hypothetical protein